MSNLATGASRAATGSITANVASTLTLTDASHQVLISNTSAVVAYVRLNSATVSATVYDFFLLPGDEEAIEDVEVKTVGVYMNATSGLRVIYW